MTSCLQRTRKGFEVGGSLIQGVVLTPFGNAGGVGFRRFLRGKEAGLHGA